MLKSQENRVPDREVSTGFRQAYSASFISIESPQERVDCEMVKTYHNAKDKTSVALYLISAYGVKRSATRGIRP